MMIRLFLGGSFDPVHDGHMQMVRHIHHRLSALPFDFTLRFLPTAGSPFKDKTTISHHRLQMLMAAGRLLEEEGIFIQTNTLEISQTPPVYTIDTIEFLLWLYGKDEVIFVMGGDSLSDLHLWRDYQTIISSVRIWAFARAGNAKPIQDDISAKITTDFDEFLYDNRRTIFYDTTPIPAVSSTQIRQTIIDGNKPPHLPEPIFDYIKTHELYKSVL